MERTNLATYSPDLLVFRSKDQILVTGRSEYNTASKIFGGQIFTFVNCNLTERDVAYRGFVASEVEKVIFSTGVEIHCIGVSSAIFHTHLVRFYSTPIESCL